MNVRTVTGAATLTDTDEILLCQAVSNGFNVVLPSATGRKGKVFTVRRIDTLTNTNYTVSVRGPIDDSFDRHLWTRSSYITLVSDGTVWRMISEGNNNVFTTCDSAINTTVYMDCNFSTLDHWFCQKKMIVGGNWNLIDRLHARGGSTPSKPGSEIQLEINGNDNIVDRSLKDTNSVITGTGLRTKIDGVLV